MQIRSTIVAAAAVAVMLAVAPAFAEESAPAKPTTPAVAASASVPCKAGVVDIRKIGSESVSGKKILAALKVRFDKYRKELEAKAKKLDKQKAALEAKGREMTKAQREAKIKELEKGVDAYRELMAKSEKKMQENEQASTGKFLEEIEAVVKEYGRTHGYALICATGGLIYNDSAAVPEDLTDEIMKEVDAAHGK